MSVGAQAALSPRSGKAEQGHRVEIERMMGLETAAKMLGGQQALADALGLASTRSLRAKLNAERGVSAFDLDMAATALEARADWITEHARKLRALKEQA